MVRRWEVHANFDLYDDAVPALVALRAHGLALGLISNGQRDLRSSQCITLSRSTSPSARRSHGRTKPHPSIFEKALTALGVEASETAMIGDSYADDIEGARALGITAILLDRDDRYPEEPLRITDLRTLPAVLGLT